MTRDVAGRRDMHWLLERDLQVVGGDLSAVLLDVITTLAVMKRKVVISLFLDLLVLPRCRVVRKLINRSVNI